MNPLIIYATRHGCAEEAAKKLQSKIKCDVKLVNIKKDSIPDLTTFDIIIIGGSIHASRIQNGIKNFYKKNISTLLQKQLGLYLCCMEEGEKAQKQFNDAYPVELRNHAIASGLFGGAFNLEKMNFLERMIVKKVAKVSESVAKVKETNIEQFAITINEQIK